MASEVKITLPVTFVPASPLAEAEVMLDEGTASLKTIVATSGSSGSSPSSPPVLSGIGVSKTDTSSELQLPIKIQKGILMIRF